MLVHKEFHSKKFSEFSCYHFDLLFIICVHHIPGLSCRHLANAEAVVDTLWQILTHAFCARCREKGKGTDNCLKNPQTSDCKICNAFSEEQCLQLATSLYRIKKEKREAKKLEATPTKLRI